MTRKRLTYEFNNVKLRNCDFFENVSFFEYYSFEVDVGYSFNLFKANLKAR